MEKHKILIAFILLLSALLSPSGSIEAATCDHLKDNISKERSALKRRALFRQAIEVCGDDAELRYSFALELERHRKYDEALERYKEVLKLDPTMAKTYFNMGDIYKSQKQYAEAVKAYESGLQIDKENSRALKNLKELKQALK